MKIGIIGAENSHSLAIARALNIQKACGRARAVVVWGEKTSLARQLQEKGEVPALVRDPREMLGQVDAVVVAHRSGAQHAVAALPFLRKGIPVFVDKPLALTLSDAQRMLRAAARSGAPIASFSVLSQQKSFAQIKRNWRALGPLRLVESTGPCDTSSPWGGAAFYGIHQIDSLLRLAGPGVELVQAMRAKNGDATVTLRWRDTGPLGIMRLVKSIPTRFIFSAAGSKGRQEQVLTLDEDPYITGLRKVVSMFRTGKPILTPAQMLEPIAVLEAVTTSLKTGAPVRVKKFS